MRKTSENAADAGPAKKRELGPWAKGVLFFFFLLFLLEAGLRLAGTLYNENRPTVFGEAAGGAPGKTVLSVGDSYTYGGNVEGKQAYPYYLWTKLRQKNVRVVNGGHCEYNSSQVLAELPGNLEKFKPAVVILLAGSSDKWNILGEKPGDATLIYRPDYDGSLENAPLPTPGTRNPLLNLRVYKMARAIYLNAKFRYLLHNAAAIDPGELAGGYKAGKLSDKNLNLYLRSLFYNSLYENLFELALAAIENVPADSPYYSHNLSYYFSLAIAFDFQSKYSARMVTDRFNALLARRPELAQNEAFMKYLRYFGEKSRLEPLLAKRLAENLDAMAALVKRSGAVLVVMNYPSSHTAANKALQDAALKNKALFVDNHAAFAALIAKNGREKYLMGDDHATPLGHEVMAGLMLPEIRRALE